MVMKKNDLVILIVVIINQICLLTSVCVFVREVILMIVRIFPITRVQQNLDNAHKFHLLSM